jgi:hypothetical protein
LVTIGCGKPRRICNVAKKWAENKQNVGMVRWTNNQAPTPRPTHEQKHARMIFEKTSIKHEANSCSCKYPTKEAYNCE